jgi:hypothetical protein
VKNPSRFSPRGVICQKLVIFAGNWWSKSSMEIITGSHPICWSECRNFGAHRLISSCNIPYSKSTWTRWRFKIFDRFWDGLNLGSNNKVHKVSSYNYQKVFFSLKKNDFET